MERGDTKDSRETFFIRFLLSKLNITEYKKLRIFSYSVNFTEKKCEKMQNKNERGNTIFLNIYNTYINSKIGNF